MKLEKRIGCGDALGPWTRSNVNKRVKEAIYSPTSSPRCTDSLDTLSRRAAIAARRRRGSLSR